jgi:hypothetical protein
MRHLYEYEDEEIKSMMTDLEEVGHGQLKGWIVYGIPFNSNDTINGGAYYAITAENKDQAIYYFLGESITNYEDAEKLQDSSQPKTFKEADEALMNWYDDEMGVSVKMVWEGLTPKKSKPSSEVYLSNNIVLTLERLKEHFLNVESVLKSNPDGKEKI